MTENFAQSYTPQPGILAPDGDSAWREAMMNAGREGRKVSPRGQDTIEMLHGNLVSIDMARAVVTSPVRKLSHQFMAAEALWIVNGQNDLKSLERFAPSYGRFSDDGETLAGAYGPRFVAQRNWAVEQLHRDRDTRQAVIQVWRETPAPSKDIPCTLAWAFSIRGGLLHLHAMMRSSDLWMGLPYDMFSFATVGLWVACRYNATAAPADRVGLGTLTIAATSSHIYLRDIDKVKAVLESPAPGPVAPTPDDLVKSGDWPALCTDLLRLREGQRRERWEIVPQAKEDEQ